MSESSIQQSYQGQFYLDNIDDLDGLIEKDHLDVLGVQHFCQFPKIYFQKYHRELLFQPWRSDRIRQRDGKVLEPQNLMLVRGQRSHH